MVVCVRVPHVSAITLNRVHWCHGKRRRIRHRIWPRMNGEIWNNPKLSFFMWMQTFFIRSTMTNAFVEYYPHYFPHLSQWIINSGLRTNERCPTHNANNKNMKIVEFVSPQNASPTTVCRVNESSVCICLATVNVASCLLIWRVDFTLVNSFVARFKCSKTKIIGFGTGFSFFRRIHRRAHRCYTPTNTLAHTHPDITRLVCLCGD